MLDESWPLRLELQPVRTWEECRVHLGMGNCPLECGWCPVFGGNLIAGRQNPLHHIPQRFDLHWHICVP
jgi:hypothetical protein